MSEIEWPGEIEVFTTQHLPIVTAYVDKLGLVELLNTLVSSEMDVEPGGMFLAMLLDTLSGRSPLYRVEEFFESQDIELLLGREIEAKSLNDDNLGRFLDTLYQRGTIQIFTEIAKRAVDRCDVSCRHVHFDTTSVSVFGEYKGEKKGDSQGTEQAQEPVQEPVQEPSQEPVQEPSQAPYVMTYGHSKDHRADLKQFLVSMLCVDRNVPIFASSEDGNASDKTINNEILTTISRRMAAFGIEEGAFMYIADSALITEKNLKTLGDGILFISRLPANYAECQRVIREAVDKNVWEEIGIIAETTPTQHRPGTSYRAYETEVELYEKQYRAVVIHSSAHDRRRQKRIERELQAESTNLQTDIKNALKIDYACHADAEAAAERLASTKSTDFTITAQVEERPTSKRGHPKGGIKEIAQMRYGISALITEDTVAISTLREEAGCFVLVSNVPKANASQETQMEEQMEEEEKKKNEHEEVYDSCALLKAYKEQQGLEQNFGFLKDPAIVERVFLDSPERLEALG